MELQELNVLITSIAFYPVIFFAALVNFIVYPILILIKLVTLDFAGALADTAQLWNIFVSFLKATWEVPYSWIYQGYAVSYNILYFLILVFMELARVGWEFFKVYLNWLFDIIGITFEFFYNTMYWVFNLIYWFPHYLLKFSILFVQWAIEVTWDLLVWCWNTFWLIFEWLLNVSILVPAFLTAKLIVIFEWGTLFAWKYKDYIDSPLFDSVFAENYYTAWIIVGILTLYNLLFPITYPLTALILGIAVIIFAWIMLEEGLR